ncbi:MAG: AsmA family protein, partial [Comamonadaceae bacterium]
FQVLLKGASMADLYDLTGLVLPNTPRFETNGRLTGSLEPERAVWEYTNFNGKVGQSDLHGSLKYTSGKPRPRLTGTMTSNQLRLADLGPTIGAGKGDTPSQARAPRGKVLPDSKFAAERWNAMDMDITFKGQHIIRPESLPLEDLSLRAVMENAQLKLAPLTFGVAGGKIESQVSIDGRAAPLKGQVRGTVQGLQLSELFPKVQLMKKSFGRMDGAIALESTGSSVASLLGEGTGEMRLYVRDGTLSKQMLDLAALNLGSIVVGKLFGDTKEVHLRCAVADFTVVKGLATTRVVKMSTEDAIVEATGTIDLGTEELNLRIKPESLDWKFFSLRSPLYVKGTFGDPKVGVEAGPLLLR